jgi:hypothetical protein
MEDMSRRCGYCYRRGHDKRTCPELDRFCRENPDSFTARQRSKETKKVRRCSWCKESGHNRSTCPELAKFKKETKEEIVEWRKTFQEHSNKIGFGVGTLVKFIDPDTIENNYRRGRIESWINKLGNYAIVVGLQQERLDHRQHHNPTNCVYYRFTNGHEMASYLPTEFGEAKTIYGGHLFQIAAGIEGDIADNFNSHWYTGGDAVNWYVEHQRC